jgi:hypothetical protein
MHDGRILAGILLINTYLFTFETFAPSLICDFVIAHILSKMHFGKWCYACVSRFEKKTSFVRPIFSPSFLSSAAANKERERERERERETVIIVILAKNKLLRWWHKLVRPTKLTIF